MGQDNLLDVKVQKQKVKVIKHNPKISEPMLKYSSTGHRFANTNSTLTASFSAQYQYTAHGSATVFIHMFFFSQSINQHKPFLTQELQIITPYKIIFIW